MKEKLNKGKKSGEKSCCKGVNRTDETDNDNCQFNIEDFAALSAGAIYTIDFQEKRFTYVAEHDLFLCGYSSEKALQMGYDFYPKILNTDDLRLLAEIFTEIVNTAQEEQNEISYFSFNIKVKNIHLRKNKYEYLMVCHKVRPQFQNGKIRFAMCMLTSSEASQSGNFRLYYKNSNFYKEYSFADKEWIEKQTEQLTKREAEILKLVKQGKPVNTIFSTLSITESTLKHEITKLLKKFQLKSLAQVIINVTNNLQIFNNSQTEKRKGSVRR